LVIETFRLESEELRAPAESVDTIQCNLDCRRLAPGLSLRLMDDTNLQTPNIDSLVISSRTAVAVILLCSPLRGALLTGQYRHRSFCNYPDTRDFNHRFRYVVASLITPDHPQDASDERCPVGSTLIPQAEDYNTPDGNSKVMVLGH